MKRADKNMNWKKPLLVGLAITIPLSGCQTPGILGGNRAKEDQFTVHRIASNKQLTAPVSSNAAQQVPLSGDAAPALRNEGAAPQALTTKAANAVALSSRSSGMSEQVVPVQYTQPREGDSFAVPREPMPIPYGTAPYVGSPYGNTGFYGPPGYQVHQSNPMQPRSHAAHVCPCGNHGSGAYQPVYPQFSSENCGACNNQCTIDCEPLSNFAVPRQSDPQEYLFDGGDRFPKVTLRKDDTLAGLDPEDTVIQYETADGKSDVVSGCRVAVYAPRFGSVRKKLSVAQSELALRPRATVRPDGPGMVTERLPSLNVSQPIKSQNKENVRIAEAFRDRSQQTPADMVLPMLTVSEAFQPFEDLGVFRNGDLRNTDLAQLAKFAANARVWTSNEDLNVIVDGTEAVEVSSDKHQADVRLYEFKGARIRLCKVASEQMANPGDIISFTIRFDNVGEQPLSKLVVTDSLTPRLEYIAGSQKSTIDSEFKTTPNVAGSEVLRWELKEGIKPGEGGLVRFDCRVR